MNLDNRENKSRIDNGRNKKYMRSNNYIMRIAGRIIKVSCFYKHTANDWQKYLEKEKNPEIEISVSKEEIELESSSYEHAIIPERCYYGEKVSIMKDYYYYESAIICRKIADAMIDFHTLLIHGAAIALDYKCYIFIAPSGTGKTTHILNWLKVFPDSFVVNGDKPMVNVDTQTVYGTPWCGKEGLNTNTAVPLGGIIILSRGKINMIQSVTFREIVPQIINQIHIPEKTEYVIRTLRLLDSLADIPCFRLKCNTDEKSAIVAYKGICGLCNMNDK